MPLLATNLNTGLPNESLWQELESMSPKNSFSEMKQIGDVTTFLYFNNFNFKLKQSQTFKVNGIQVNMLRKGTNIKDFWVDIVFPSASDEMSLTRNNKASDNVWPFIYTDVSYGNPKELWGRPWATDEINSEQFGVVVGAKSIESSAVADLKRLEIVIHYEELILSFSKKEICQLKSPHPQR